MPPTEPDYKQLFESLLFDLHHQFRAPMCTLEGLLYLIDLEQDRLGFSPMMLDALRAQVERMKTNANQISSKYDSYQ